MQAYGRWQTMFVDAEPVRQHVQALRDAGVGSRQIHAQSGISRTTITALMTGRPFRGTGPSNQVYADTAEKLLGIPIPASYEGRAAGANISAIGTTRRLRALVAIGHSQTTLCKRFGWNDSNASKLFTGSQTRVTTATASKVAAVYEELSMTPGTCQRAKNRAKKLGWHPPLAWDDDIIDDPDAQPADCGESRCLRWDERYLELKDLSLSDVEIMRRMGIKAESLLRQLERYGLPKPKLSVVA